MATYRLGQYFCYHDDVVYGNTLVMTTFWLCQHVGYFSRETIWLSHNVWKIQDKTYRFGGYICERSVVVVLKELRTFSGVLN